MIPHAVHALDQFVADVLIFLDDIGLFAGQFNPPIAVIQAIGVKHHILGGVVHVVQDRIGLVFCLQHAKERLRIGMLAVAQLLLGEGIAALGRHKRHRMAAIHGLEQQGIAHAVLIGLLGRVRLMILRLALAAGAEWHAGHEAQRAVARAVAEHRCAQRPLDLGSHLIAMNGRNAMPLGVHIMHGGIEEHRQIFLLTDGGEQHAIPHGIVVIIVYALVFQQDLAQDAGFLGIGLDHVGRRAADMHADFAAGIAAKHRPLLHQGGFRAVARAGNGRAHARHAATNDDYIKGRFFLFAAN